MVYVDVALVVDDDDDDGDEVDVGDVVVVEYYEGALFGVGVFAPLVGVVVVAEEVYVGCLCC